MKWNKCRLWFANKFCNFFHSSPNQRKTEIYSQISVNLILDKYFGHVERNTRMVVLVRLIFNVVLFRNHNVNSNYNC